MEQDNGLETFFESSNQKFKKETRASLIKIDLLQNLLQIIKLKTRLTIFGTKYSA